MKSEQRIIDSCLAELLGDETPPDLTRQILRRMESAGVEDAAPRPCPEERIIDACLDELLGGASPPRKQLTRDVLAGLELPPGDPEPAAPPLPRRDAASGDLEPAAPPLPPAGNGRPDVSLRGSLHEPTRPPNGVTVRPRRPGQSVKRRRRRSTPAAWTWAGASALACLAALGVYWNSQGDSDRESGRAEIAVQRGADDGRSEPDGQAASATSSADGARHRQQQRNGDAELVRSDGDGKGVGRGTEPQPAPFQGPLFPTDDMVAGGAAGPDDAVDQPYANQVLNDEEVVRAMNQLLAKSWREAGVATAPAVDEQWCRRLYLQMLGRIPTVEELQRFANDDRLDRREQLIDELQQGEQYAAEYASHWAAFWGTVLVGRRGGMGADDSASREHLEAYLADAIEEDRSFDELVRELIVATGSGRPGGQDFNPAANFLLASMDDGGDKQALLATTRTFQVFHGRQVKCIQCHTHPTNDWSQKQFWSLNAFFRQMQVKRGKAGPKLVNRDFRGEGPGGIQEAEVFFERVNGETAAALPAYPGRGQVPASGRLEDVNRRQLLAEFMVNDPQLAQATINRIWSHFHGYGFTKPVDDMGPHNPVSHPELMKLLSQQFVEGGYSLNRLVRWVAASDGFNRSSQLTVATKVDDPEAGGRPLFSRYYTRQLQPEAVYDSLRLVADDGPREESTLEGRAQWLGQFIQPMGTDEGQELSTYGGDVRQSLIIMNGPLMKKATSAGNRDGLLHSVVTSKLSFEDKVEHLFLAAVAREPTRRELAAVRDLRTKQSPAADEEVVLESVWWALLNSNEFILDH